VSWRAIGCGGLAVTVFVLVGLFGIWRAVSPAQDCPPEFQTPSGTWRPIGEPTTEPGLPGSAEQLERAGEIGFGLATWELWVVPGTAPSASADPLPDRLVLGCADDAFQAYARDGR
jgi:hypothetical protein